ncbi:hypothetical protein DMX06_11070 [Pseudomonas mosselii]|nr:hypothetical protein DMX06_11070 [Pseudomonas mosselii]
MFCSDSKARCCLNDPGAAMQPFRDTRPLLQKTAIPCRSGLVSRKGRKAPPTVTEPWRATPGQRPPYSPTPPQSPARHGSSTHSPG